MNDTNNMNNAKNISSSKNVSNTKKIVRTLLIINALQLSTGLLAWSYIGKVSLEENDYFEFFIMGMLLLTSMIILVGLYLAWRSNDNQFEETLHDLESLNMTLRAQRHDYLNHFQVIYGLMELGEYEEARKYLEPVFKEINKVGKVLKTAQPAVNALLQAKLETAEKAGIEVYLDIHSDLKELPMEAWNLCKILANVIDNAIRALTERAAETLAKEAQTTEGSTAAIQQPPRMKIAISEEANAYYFTITDNGPEIPEGIRRNIYAPGVTTRKEEGHGMGLYIVKRILQEAGGKIEFQTTPENTSFYIMLPRLTDVK